MFGIEKEKILLLFFIPLHPFCRFVLMRCPSKRFKAAHHTLVLTARLIGMKRNPFTYLGRGCQNASDKIRKGKRVCASPQASLSVKEFLTFLPAIALRRCKLNCYSEGWMGLSASVRCLTRPISSPPISSSLRAFRSARIFLGENGVYYTIFRAIS